jgi:hypothetical protein
MEVHEDMRCVVTHLPHTVPGTNYYRSGRSVVPAVADVLGYRTFGRRNRIERSRR